MEGPIEQPFINRLVRESVILPDSIRDTALSAQESNMTPTKEPLVPSIPNNDRSKKIEDRPIPAPVPNQTLKTTSFNFSQVLAISAAQRSIRVWKRSLLHNQLNGGILFGEGRLQSLDRETRRRSSVSPEKAAPKVITLEDKLGANTELDVIGNLNLSGLNITDTDVRTILQHRPWERKKCIGIILRDNDLTSFGVYLLVDGLIAAKAKLKYLSLSNNPRVGDMGIEQIVRLLKASQTMTFLSLPCTGITDRGIRMLADTLCGTDTSSTCARLEKLHISYNKLITDKSVDALLEILKKHQSIKSLWVQNCSLSEMGRERLRKAMMRTKRRISLSE